MPINEIHAPVYIKGKYTTPAYPQGHAFRLYFQLGSSWADGLEGDEQNWRLMFLGDDLGSAAGIVDAVFDRASTLLPENTHISEIELWRSLDGDNLLEHINTLPIGNSYGSGPGVAAAYYMEVYAGPLREPWRFTLFDGSQASPQRFTPLSPPLADDNSFSWYFLNGPIPFATNDGVRLSVQKSRNTGYNRKLARAYGRTIAP